MSQFMTPAVSPDAVQSLASGGQLLQEQFNQRQENARTGARIGADLRMHSEALAQDSAEKAAYREHQSQITAAQLAANQTEAAKERELRVRLQMSSLEHDKAIAEAEDAAAEAAASGDPAAIKAANDAKEALIQAKIDKEAAAAAHSIVASRVGKAGGAAASEFDKTTSAMIAAQKMYKDALGSKFREIWTRMDANDPNLPFSGKARALRDLAGGNEVQQGMADEYLRTGGQRSTTVLPDTAVTRSIERFAGDEVNRVASLMGMSTHMPVSDEELRSHATGIAQSFISEIANSEEFGSIVEDPSKRAAAGSLMAQMASLLVARGGMYQLKAGAVPEGGKIAANAKPELDARIQDIAEQLEGMGVTAQEQNDFFESLSEQAAGAMGVSDVQKGMAAASKTDGAPDKFASEDAFNRSLGKVFMTLSPALRGALGGQVHGTSALEALKEKTVRILETYEGTPEQDSKLNALLGEAKQYGMGDKLSRLVQDYGVTEYGKSRDKAKEASSKADKADQAYDAARRADELARNKAASTARRKTRQAGTTKAMSELEKLVQP